MVVVDNPNVEKEDTWKDNVIHHFMLGLMFVYAAFFVPKDREKKWMDPDDKVDS